jgi:hypothetical protein
MFISVTCMLTCELQCSQVLTYERTSEQHVTDVNMHVTDLNMHVTDVTDVNIHIQENVCQHALEI